VCQLLDGERVTGADRAPLYATDDDPATYSRIAVGSRLRKRWVRERRDANAGGGASLKSAEAGLKTTIERQTRAPLSDAGSLEAPKKERGAGKRELSEWN